MGKIPVLVFSTSHSEGDVAAAYQMGGNSFIRKPDSFQAMVELMKTIKHYWGETVQLPKL